MLSVTNLKTGYDGKTVVDLADLTVSKGAKCLIRGNSGCGKTTLLYALAGLGDIQQGRVVINQTDIYALAESARDHFRGKNIGIVFQTLHLVKSLTVIENILLGAFVSNAEQNTAWAEVLLDKLGIADLRNRSAAEISQGQAQRVAIARALLNKPALLLADEPTSSLDHTAAMQVIALLKDLSSETQTTLIVSSHDDRIMHEFEHTLPMGEAA